MAKLFDADGNVVEAALPEEVSAAVSAAVAAKETEFTGKLTEAEKKIQEKDAALAARAGEFGQFRELHKDVVAKLGEAERQIYENQLAQKKEADERAAREKAAHEATVKSVIKAKAGTNAALETKMNEMWPLIGIEATTPEQIEQKVAMVLGAIGSTQPDLVASVAGFTGSHVPPVKVQKDGESFADTERGKQGAAELGLNLGGDKK